MPVDWWQVNIKDAIQQYSIDYARFLCYGTNTVTDAAGAMAQANTDCVQEREPYHQQRCRGHDAAPVRQPGDDQDPRVSTFS